VPSMDGSGFTLRSFAELDPNSIAKTCSTMSRRKKLGCSKMNIRGNIFLPQNYTEALGVSDLAGVRFGLWRRKRPNDSASTVPVALRRFWHGAIKRTLSEDSFANGPML
jgi:hypothetical protein